MKMKKEQVQIGCGCWKEVDEFDRKNIRGMVCLPCVQQDFPWFMHPDPDGRDAKNWAKVDAQWVFNKPQRAPGHWEWIGADFDKGEQSPHLEFIED